MNAAVPVLNAVGKFHIDHHAPQYLVYEQLYQNSCTPLAMHLGKNRYWLKVRDERAVELVVDYTRLLLEGNRAIPMK